VIKRQSGINTTLSWISKGQASSFDMLCLGMGQLCLESLVSFCLQQGSRLFLTGKVARKKKNSHVIVGKQGLTLLAI
jgi:hypothetical protein